MSTFPTSHEFLRLLQQSGLLLDRDDADIRQLVVNGKSAHDIATHLVHHGVLTEWQAERLLSGSHQLSIGKYPLTDLISETERYAVYMAAHPQMNRRVTICVAQAAGQSTAVAQEFLVQAKRLADVNHPHLAHVLDYDEDADRCYLVMEYVDGETILAWHARYGRHHPDTTMRVMLQVASALAYLEQQGIQHGELDVDKILIDRGFNAKICGLWESCWRASTGHANDDDMARRDVVSFGSILNSLARDVPGLAPSDSLELLDLARQMMDEHGLPPKMTQVVVRLRCLLDRMLTDVTAGSPRPHLPYEAEKEARPVKSTDSPLRGLLRSKSAMVAAGVLAILLVVSAIAWIWFSARQTNSPRLATSDTIDRANQVTSKKKVSQPQSSRKKRSPRASDNDPISLSTAGTLNNPDSSTAGPSDVVAPSDPAAIPSSPSAPPAESSDKTVHEPAPKAESIPVAESTPPSDQRVTADTPKNDDDAPSAPPTPPPATNPFVDLPAAIELPAIVKNRVSEIFFGAVPTTDDTTILLDILGSQSAHRGKFVFAARRSDGQGPWTISLAKPNKADAAEDIATILVADGQMRFRWATEVNHAPIARHLANCQVQLRSGEFQHRMWLRDNVSEIDPVRALGTAAAVRVKLPLILPPAVSALKLEVVELSPEFGDTEIEPRGLVAIDSGQVRIRVGEKKRKFVECGLKIDTKRASAWSLLVTPRFFSPLTSEWLPWTADQFARTEQAIITAKQAIPSVRRQFSEFKETLQESRRATSQQINDMSAEHAARIRQVEAAFDDLQELRNFVQQVSNARIRFRIIYIIDETSIELVRCREFTPKSSHDE